MSIRFDGQVAIVTGAALMGLSADAAIQGKALGVQANGVRPVSCSRLAIGGPPDVADRLAGQFGAVRDMSGAILPPPGGPGGGP